MASLDKYRSNVYSQFGEDGVLKEICRRLNISTGYFVEFGAWDGKFLSNTFHLLEQGWRGVYIEGDREKYEQLCRNMIPYAEKVVLLNKFVRVDGPTKLDNILCEAHAPRDLELLSIDVDSNDWHIWLGLKTFQPKILVIEVISSIPAGVIQTHRGEDVLGSSFSAAIELGKLKGYTAVCHTGNIIFVRNELIPRLNLPEDELLFPELLFDYSWLKKPLVSAAPQSTKKTRLLSRLQSAHQQLRGILLRIRQRTPAKETITTTNSTSSQFFSSCADSTNQDYLHPPVDHPFYLHLLDLKTAVSSYASSDSLRILDFGAGTSPYRSLFPNSDYRRADLPGSPAVDYVLSAHSTIDEADEYFDLVISTQVLEHVETP
ncbi:MAG TPA: class I SAM-dependent methyltransferase, partial [Oligoflexia bacterium]|nr:class I SAM-dependent methyltransferase [Oligoflexia bacterium]